MAIHGRASALKAVCWAGAWLLVGSATQAQGRYDEPHEGEGTFYGYSGGGNCSFPPPTRLTAALTEAD